jgi:hypothetical protein
MKNYITILIALFLFLLIGCKSGCLEVREHCLSLNYYFMITAKSKDRFIEFKGVDRNHNKVDFKEFEHWNIYNSVEIGDTLIKKSGETEILLIKNDTTLVFPLICEGKIIDKFGKMW